VQPQHKRTLSRTPQLGSRSICVFVNLEACLAPALQ
jgi:hypothetical protein